jgi:hypothetical protein
MTFQRDLFAQSCDPDEISGERLLATLAAFTWKNRPTSVSRLRDDDDDDGAAFDIPVFTNEFWTSRQRAAHSLHEISYRACFKPQLPGFFVNRLSRPGDTVYDPFAGRGTTLLEAALQGRAPAGCDVNALSRELVWPRLSPPTLSEIADRLQAIDLRWDQELPTELLTFYHPQTLGELCALREYLLTRRDDDTSDAVDDWIRMVTLNRLTGHSAGFLSVYTLPPNQAVTVDAQRKINASRGQTPPLRNIRAVILRKSAALLADVDDFTRTRLARARATGRFRVGSCTDSFWPAESVQLIVTSPPFLDVVDYAADNWLRCWLCGLDASQVTLEMRKTVDSWRLFVERSFTQFARLLQPGGFVAFEVGEVRGGSVRLETAVAPCGRAAGLRPIAVLINEQSFTKTANIWGVSNNAKGTNTNRVVIFQKPVVP